MRYLVLSDVHGRDLAPVLDLVEEKQFDALLFLGDLDLMRSIRQLKELVDEFKETGRETFLVPGNHDHALYANLNVSSGTLREQGANMAMLHRELAHNKDLEQFIKHLVEKQDPDTPTPHSTQFTASTLAVAAVHGGFAGSLQSFPDCPETIQDLWYRIQTKTHAQENISVMEKHGYTLLLRGHDHRPFSVHEENGDVNREKITEETTIPLTPGNRYIVTVGAYYDGWYATLTVEEDERPRLRMHRISF